MWKKNTNIKYNALLLATAFIWGIGFVAVKIGLEEGMQPFFISATRFFIAAIILAVIIRKKIRHITPSTYKKGGILGSLLFIAFSFQTIALKYTTVANNAFITTLYVVFVPFLYWIIYKKRPKTLHFIACIISLIGVRLLHNSIANTINIGDFLTLLCAIAFGLHITLLGEYVKKHDPIVLTFLQLLVTSILSFVFSLVFEPVPSISTKGIVVILYLGIFSSCLAYMVQNITQKHISQINVALIISTEAFFGAFLSALILKESLTWKILLGGTLVFVAIIIAEIKFTALTKSPKKTIEPSTEINIDKGK